MYFFNYTETHWTLLVRDVSEEKWTHTLYNFLEVYLNGAARSAAQEQLAMIDALIQGASCFPKPKHRELVVDNSAQQTDPYDCGVITVYNAVELLNGRKPEEQINSKLLRLEYITRIISKLESGMTSDSADSRLNPSIVSEEVTAVGEPKPRALWVHQRLAHEDIDDISYCLLSVFSYFDSHDRILFHFHCLLILAEAIDIIFLELLGNIGFEELLNVGEETLGLVSDQGLCLTPALKVSIVPSLLIRGYGYPGFEE